MDQHPGISSPRIVVTKLESENVSRPALRQPPVFDINDNFEDWEYQVRVYLHGVSPAAQGPYIISFLSKEAGRDFRSTGVDISSPADIIFETFKALFGQAATPGLFELQFEERKQRAEEDTALFV